MSANLLAFGYLIAAVCFIQTLRSWSSTMSHRGGGLLGVAGMTIAVLFTLFSLSNAGPSSYIMIMLALIIGGGVGLAVIIKFPTIAIPHLMTAFQSLVGLAAILIAVAALYSPFDFGITDAAGHVFDTSLLEMGLGSVMGAVAFSGSAVAFGKSQERLPSAPIAFPSRHRIYIGLGVAVILLLMAFMATASQLAFWMMTILALVSGFVLIMPIGDVEMPAAASMLNAHSGWATASIGFMLNNPMLIIAGALVGSSSTVLCRSMCKQMNRSFISVFLEEPATASSTKQLTMR